MSSDSPVVVQKVCGNVQNGGVASRSVLACSEIGTAEVEIEGFNNWKNRNLRSLLSDNTEFGGPELYSTESRGYLGIKSLTERYTCRKSAENLKFSHVSTERRVDRTGQTY